jgi:glycosyltransferase involved in cell wall biosynthesis
MSQTPRLRVMHITLNLERDGAQEVVRTLTDYLQANGCEITVCAFRDGPIRQPIEDLGAKVEIPTVPSYGRVWLPKDLVKVLHFRRELVRFIQDHDIDVVQTHLLGDLDFLALTLRYGTNLRGVLWTIHNVDFLPISSEPWVSKLKRLVDRLLYRLLANKVDGFIAVSDEVCKAVMEQIGPIHDRVVTISNGVDVKRFERPGNKPLLCAQLGIDPNSRLITTVGRLTVQKGHSHLIEAAKTIVPCCPDAHFLLIGKGELQEELQCQIQEAEVAGSFHFLGSRDDVPDLLAATDLFVLPSLWEGLSIALLEAMAAGKPIVATAVSGTTQSMIHGETGLVIPPRDSKALADAILWMLSEPERARAMGQAAKQHVIQNFSAQKQAMEHIALYRRLVGNR